MSGNVELTKIAFKRADDGLEISYREAAKADGEYTLCRPSTKNWRTNADTPATAGVAIEVPDLEAVAHDASPSEPDADAESIGSPAKIVETKSTEAQTIRFSMIYHM